MRKIISAMHITLDGLVAGPNGELNWAALPEGLFDFVATLTEGVDTALYGRVTWQMMEDYWPNAGDQPMATKHDIEHAAWYNKIDKLVLSNTMMGEKVAKTSFVGGDVAAQIKAAKQGPGSDFLLLGSPSTCNFLTENELIDEYWLFLNPIILANGQPLFKKLTQTALLELIGTKTFDQGVIGLHYKRKQ